MKEATLALHRPLCFRSNPAPIHCHYLLSLSSQMKPQPTLEQCVFSDKPSCILSNKEILEKCVNGLCFISDEQFKLRHRYKKQQRFMLDVLGCEVSLICSVTLRINVHASRILGCTIFLHIYLLCNSVFH